MPKLVERATYSRRRLSEAELAAWRSFLRAHAALTGRLERDLAEAGGISLSEYDVLLNLAGGPPEGLRPSDLAERVLLTRSGLTRLVDRLVELGHVERRSCPTDRRGQLLVLTVRGRAALRAAAPVHLGGVARGFVAVLSPGELARFGRLAERIAQASGDRTIAHGERRGGG